MLQLNPSYLRNALPAVDKGLAFPTCVNVNNCVAHYSPLESEAAVVLADGDIVKVQLGVHIDGFCAMAAHTAVVGAADARPVVGPSADVLAAAYAAAQIAVRLVKPGNKNSQVTEAIRRVAEAYGVTPLAGVLSHELKQFVVDGNKVILLREDHDTKVEEVRRGRAPSRRFRVSVVAMRRRAPRPRRRRRPLCRLLRSSPLSRTRPTRWTSSCRQARASRGSWTRARRSSSATLRRTTSSR